MKKVIIALMLITMTILTNSDTYALDTGTAVYGTDVSGYIKVGTGTSSVLAERNAWDYTVGWTDYYYYYTYYLYDKLEVNALSIDDNKFTYVNGTVKGKYEIELNYREDRELSFGLSFSKFNQSVTPSIKFYQSWEYRYAQGEETIFDLDGYSGYVSTLMVSLKATIVRRTYIVEKHYGNLLQGNAYLGSDIRFVPNTEEEQKIIWDYDLVPVYWTNLTQSQKNMFSNYTLTFANQSNFDPSNLKQVYLDRLPVSVRGYYY